MTITRVLVANRGEIAARVIGACHDLGLEAVAVYSDADRDAPYVDRADHAVHIGRSEARYSYLDAATLIEAAARSGAAALHPGYGFLAENADFAQACVDAGLVFVGPSPGVIRLMGSKIAAKGVAGKAGVPVLAGYHGDDQSDETLSREARRIGMPLLIKASAGGGGRGMREVHDPVDFEPALDAARREAEAVFGDGAVLLERFVPGARHIEVQVLADASGNVRHLFERDCSLQRNHQKIIEEAPAPDLDPALRAQLLDGAVRLAESIRYEGAGTIEYLFDPDAGAAFFMEMNTRLQVEHPVTEAVTGIDIVQWQLRIAGGERLSISQAEIGCQGWAVEARVTAEDPADAYRPQTGTVTAYSEPELRNLRIDSGIHAGSRISHHYDSLLAKVIGRGHDRAAAIRALRRGLDRLLIAGPGTNTDFLCALLDAPAFRSGSHDTATLEKLFPDGWPGVPVRSRAKAEAALASMLQREQTRAAAASDPWHTLGAWRITEPAGHQGAAIVQVDGDDVRVAGRLGTYRIEVVGQVPFEVTDARLDEGQLRYESEGRRHTVPLHIDGSRFTVSGAGGRGCFDVHNSAQAPLDVDAGTNAGGDGRVLAPMPGMIAETPVALGARVTAGQTLVVLEAMKLLQSLCAPCDGTITEIRYATGDTVEAGNVLAVIEPET